MIWLGTVELNGGPCAKTAGTNRLPIAIAGSHLADMWVRFLIRHLN
jgi:hypothetical protein